MFDEELYWKPRMEELRGRLRSAKYFEQAVPLALELHAVPHFSEMSGCGKPTFADEVWEGLAEADFSVMPTAKDDTIAWHFWHTTRIEDLVGNVLIAESRQVLDDAWLRRLGVEVRDTGNAMTDPEILDLSRRLDKAALRDYRNEVGRRTEAILRTLRPEDLRRKPSPESLERLLSEGGLLADRKDSCWLKDFWGSKTCAGLLLLPLIRHHIRHLTACVQLKAAIQAAQ